MNATDSPPTVTDPQTLDWGRLAYVLGLIGPVDLDDTEDAFVAYAEDIRERYGRDDLEDDPQYADYVRRMEPSR